MLTIVIVWYKMLINKSSFLFLMNEEQREKLAQVLLEESLTCADRNDLDDARDLMQRSVAIKWKHTIEKILNGNKTLLKQVTRDQFCGDRTKMIIARCIMNEVVTNKEWLKKNNLGVEWYE